MATKDHTLDEKITAAAREEFLEKGFEKASVRKIADRAGITTGALYTRYRNKDALFASLLEKAGKTIAAHGEELTRGYLDVRAHPDADAFLAAMNREAAVYLDLLFDHYEDCLLLFCRSRGSSVEANLEAMMDRKARETAEFLQSISPKELDPDGVAMIIKDQFSMYRTILEKGFTREKTISCLRTVEAFQTAGWKSFLEN